MIVLSNGIINAEIEERGAQLTRLYSKTTEYLWSGDPKIWFRHAPILFPFVGRLKDGMFHYRGKEYGPEDNHGFAPTAMYTPVEVTKTSVRMQMIVSDEIRRIWPFDFSFLAVFELEQASLKITYEVNNLGKETMPYGLGSHPGFNVPLSDSLEFEDYYIEFPFSNGVEKVVSSSGSEVYKEMKGLRLPLKHELFDNDAVVLLKTGGKAVLKSDKDSRRVIVDYPECRYCALWHKVKYPAPYVCIEPWVSLSLRYDEITDIEKRPDYVKLEGGETKRHTLSITIQE